MNLHMGLKCMAVNLLLTLAILPARACLNDRDTARTEQLHALSIKDDDAGTRNAARILTGRFERNPPAYYQMRIARLKTALKQNPADIDAYDDIAVAYDRIGNDSSAIAWIEIKRKRLEQNGGTLSANMPEELKQRWYRYYANLGTFRVHQWIRHGADPKQIAEIKQGRAEIAKALEINPYAHFGREKSQLRVLEWILEVQALRPSKGSEAVPATLANYLDDGKPVISLANGFVGLIELGGAWESVDVYDAIARLWRDKRPGVALFAAERVRELLASGHHSLFKEQFPDSMFAVDTDYVEAKLTERPRSAGAAKFRMLRAEADLWNRNRAAFMEGQLARGLHPDTHSDFWSGWKEPKPPSLDLPVSEQVIYTLFHQWLFIGLAGAASVISAAIVWRRLRARRLPHIETTDSCPTL